jgi:Lipocalin-like domain
MPTPSPDLAPLVGSWRLSLTEAVFIDNGERFEPWGSDPAGRMVLDSTGRIMFLFTKSNRIPPITDAERATLFNELLSYTGVSMSAHDFDRARRARGGHNAALPWPPCREAVHN